VILILLHRLLIKILRKLNLKKKPKNHKKIMNKKNNNQALKRIWILYKIQTLMSKIMILIILRMNNKI